MIWEKNMPKQMLASCVSCWSHKPVQCCEYQLLFVDIFGFFVFRYWIYSVSSTPLWWYRGKVLNGFSFVLIGGSGLSSILILYISGVNTLTLTTSVRHVDTLTTPCCIDSIFRMTILPPECPTSMIF